MENLLETNEADISDRVMSLEKKVHEQEETINSLKSTIKDLIQRLQLVENHQTQVQNQQSTIHTAPAPVLKQPIKTTRSPQQSARQTETKQQRPLTSSSSTKITVKTDRSVSATSIDSANAHQNAFLKESGQVRLFIRGRPVTFALPTSDVEHNVDAVLEAPAEVLKLEWVYGYRGKDCRSNLFKLPTNELVYFIAAVVVLYNPDERTQRHYLGHTDDVKSLALHPDRITVATGQSTGHEERAHIRIWETVNLTTLKILGLSDNDFQNSICCLSFSKTDDGLHLAAVDDAGERTLSVWNWQNGTKIAHTKCYGDSVLVCEFHPTERNAIVTGGKQHLLFWSFNSLGTTANSALPKKSASFELTQSVVILNANGSVANAKPTTPRLDKPKYILSLGFLPTGEPVTGDSDGNLIVWNMKESKISKVIKDVHEGGVFSVTLANGFIITGGKDSKLIEWNADFQKTGRQLQLPEVNGVARFITYDGRDFFVGTTRNCIFKANFELNFLNCILNGHNEELWGLSGSTSSNESNFITCGNDKNLTYWDTLSHQHVWSVQLEEKAHCVHVHPHHDLAAVGFAKSKWVVYDLIERKVIFSQLEGTEQIQCIQYSPDGLYLACGSRDNSIYVYNVTDEGRKYSRVGKCAGHSSHITHLDWSEDSQFLMSNSADYEVLVWQASTCKQILHQNDIKDLKWATNTCTLSVNTIGIWNSAIDGTDINACCVSKSKQLLASVDDFGKVNLLKYPCVSFKAQKKSFAGHSSHVTNITFLNNDSRLISVGGNDMAVFQWMIRTEN